MNHIFLNPGRRSEWCKLLDAGDPTATRILENLRNQENVREPLAEGDPNINERQLRLQAIQKQACLAWLEEDRTLAASALDQFLRLTQEFTGSDLGKAADAQLAVLLWDFASDLWESKDRKILASHIERMARGFLETGKGNPHVVTNNWWMLTHGACLLACIAVDGEEGMDGPIDLLDLKQWALERFKAFCGLFGNAGLYHEGSGYIAYTLSMLIPTLIAVERHLEPGILNQFPQFRKSISSMLVGTASFEHQNNGADQPTFGASLQWNDAGRGCLGLNPFIPGMEIAPDEQKGALRTVFDRLFPIGRENPFECPYRGIPLLVALYPFSTTPADPTGVLPSHVLDERQGLGMWRSEWGDGTESVFGWYARSTHVGGHAQDDAASIRLMALGRTWICGGGQARDKAEWQSVFTHADMASRPKPAPLAHLTCNHMENSGGVVGMDTRKSLGRYSERYLSWRTDLGCPFVLAIMDLLDEHRDSPLDWQWNLSFPRDLAAGIHEDGAGFSLIDKNLGRLEGRFLVDHPATLQIREMPGSTRTYSNGHKIDYPGDHFVHASFPGVKKARVLVCIAITPPNADPATIRFEDNAIYLHERKWESPFYPAMLKSVDLAQSEPNRMTLPAG